MLRAVLRSQPAADQLLSKDSINLPNFSHKLIADCICDFFPSDEERVR